MFSATLPLAGKQHNSSSNRGAYQRRGVGAALASQQPKPSALPAGCAASPSQPTHSCHHTPISYFAAAVRFADLSKEERKAVVKTVNKKGTDNTDDHAYICTEEIGAMLGCFKANDWDTMPCQVEIDGMYDCVDEHRRDPDPKVLSRRWQTAIKMQVFQHFAKKRLAWRK